MLYSPRPLLASIATGTKSSKAATKWTIGDRKFHSTSFKMHLITLKRKEWRNLVKVLRKPTDFSLIKAVRTLRVKHCFIRKNIFFMIFTGIRDRKPLKRQYLLNCNKAAELKPKFTRDCISQVPRIFITIYVK